LKLHSELTILDLQFLDEILIFVMDTGLVVSLAALEMAIELA